MAYAPPALRRRTRRRRTLAVFLIVAVLFGIVALAVRSRTDRRVGVDYLDSAKAIVDDEALLAEGLAELFTGLGDFERQDILDRLTDLSDSSAELRQQLADLDLTNAVGEVHGYLTVAVGSWDDALGLLEAAVVEVLDGRNVQTGDSMLENAFDLLRIGDRAYFGFTEALTRLDPELLGQEFNEVAFAGGERATLYDAEVLGGRLRGSIVLEGDHDVSLVASIDPEPLVEPGSVPIVPNAETFIVNLVITNSGTLVEERILVSLVGTPQSDDAEVIELRQIVPFLDPGASTNVIFDLSDLVVPGVLYELRAAVTIAQDDTPEDNVWSIVLVRNAE